MPFHRYACVYLLVLFAIGFFPHASARKRHAADWRSAVKHIRDGIRKINSAFKYIDIALEMFAVDKGRYEPETPEWVKILKSLHNKSHQIEKYLDTALDMSGDVDGLCHHKCSEGSMPMPRPGYKQPPSNGCGSSLFGLQFDGIASLSKCCNQHDRCYSTCGQVKDDCDVQFHECLTTICGDMPEILGLTDIVQVCESLMTALFNLVQYMGCKPYLDSQRDSCVCPQYEAKMEL